MINRIQIITTIVLLSLSACTSQKLQVQYGTLEGNIGLYEGNCMPSPGAPPCEPIPFSTIVYITSPNETFELNNLVDSVQSNNKGFYSIKLEPGTYSLFIKDEGKIICDFTECPDNCYCHLVKISSDSLTTSDLKIDHAVW